MAGLGGGQGGSPQHFPSGTGRRGGTWDSGSRAGLSRGVWELLFPRHPSGFLFLSHLASDWGFPGHARRVAVAGLSLWVGTGTGTGTGRELSLEWFV